MKKISLLLLSVTVSAMAMAQQFGGHPPSTAWRQINTDTVRVVFPKGLEREAADVAAITQRLGQTQSTLGDRIRKISIVLQPRTTVSNGYVGLGPWRSEFQLTPLQNSFELGSLSWHRTLALHEFRHVQQYSNFRKGVSKAVYYLFGQEGLELVNSAAVPNWFWEGDAVFQETLMSPQGRGRLPFFFNSYRSLWAGGKQYSWMKLRNGSLRDYVPDHYRLGYMLVAYGREKYGADFWSKVTSDAVRYKGLFYPFQQAIKKYTGLSYTTFRQQALAYFMEPVIKQTPDTISTWARQHKHFAGDEEYPQWMNENTLLYVNSSYKKIPAFFTLNTTTGQKSRLRVKDISLDNYFSYNNGIMVYAAFEPDLRWGWRDYSVLKRLDVNSNSQQTLTHGSHYFAPDISPGGKIVAVEVVPGKPAALHVLDGSNGKVLQVVPNTENLFYTYPKFLNEEQVVSAVRNEQGQMTLARITLSSGQTEYLLPFIRGVIGFPAVYKDTISFTASYNGKDQLYVLAGQQLFSFTPSAALLSGGYQLHVAYGRYCWSGFSAAGQHLVQGNLSAAQLVPLSASEFAGSNAPYPLQALELAHAPVLTPVAAAAYPVTRYPGSFHIFNFHSWRPFIDDPDYTLSLVGQNVLNTLQSEIYFNYNNNDKTKTPGITLTYAGLFPWLRLGTDYVIDRPYSYRNKAVYANEWEGRAGFSVPLNLSKGRSNRYLNMGSDWVFNKRIFQGTYKDTFASRSFSYLSSFVTFSNQSQQARMQIYPRWGQSLTLRLSNAVTQYKASQFLASAYWYFPGLDRSHNLVFNTAFQVRDTLNNVRFGNSFPFSRGYIGSNFHQMTKVGANYHLPLAYPDWGFANIVYFTRVRANLFYDLTHIMDYTSTKRKVTADLRSYGAEVYFDTKWWNQHEVSFGFRYSRLVDGALQGLGANQWEFILPVNLLGRN